MTIEAQDVTQRTPRGRGSGDEIRTVDGNTFDSLILEGKGPIAVEFMSYSCAHCATMEPVLKQVAETLRSKEKIFRVNIALEQELASSYVIQGTPTLVMFLNGTEVGRVEGPTPTLSKVLAAVTEPFES